MKRKEANKINILIYDVCEINKNMQYCTNLSGKFLCQNLTNF